MKLTSKQKQLFCLMQSGHTITNGVLTAGDMVYKFSQVTIDCLVKHTLIVKVGANTYIWNKHRV